ncbi:hypothetical protein GN956_G10099 [Arapaima gigas]
MAAVEVMTPIFLPRWEGQERSVRFLYLADGCSFHITSSCDVKESMVPLFLGADLFSKTDIRTENHPKYHAKYAKKGLATKLTFSSAFRFHGLRLPTSSNSLWFYSIQGFFRVAFELYSQQEQLSLLDTFQELWKSRINDGPLNMCYYISVQLNCPNPRDIVKLHNTELELRLRYLEVPEKEVHIPQMTESSVVTTQDAVPPPDPILTTDHDYCCPTHVAPHSHALSSIAQRIRSLSALIEAPTPALRPEQDVVTILLEHTEKWLKKELDERGLADLILTLLETKIQGSGGGDSVYSSTLLQAVSGWLGRQFFFANGCISQRVESFKVQHIESISDLPPAEELVGELFPEAMQILLLNWMGLSEDSAHWKRHSEYPILLLILEFANHNLITGVAHVLYSSLICK